VVPVQLENGAVLYIEAQEETDTLASNLPSPADETGEQRRTGQKGISTLPIPCSPSPTQSMQMVQTTIRTYALYCLNSFKNFGVANVDEVTLEFGINLSADAGIPYIASGKAQSNLKITVKCSYNKSNADSESHEAEPTKG
jgi:hypothetical protein